MPTWSDPQPGEDGQIRHELAGERCGAVVAVDVLLRATAVSIVVLVDGTDDETVARCKQRAERLLIEARR